MHIFTTTVTIETQKGNYVVMRLRDGNKLQEWAGQLAFIFSYTHTMDT